MEEASSKELPFRSTKPLADFPPRDSALPRRHTFVPLISELCLSAFFQVEAHQFCESPVKAQRYV